MFPTADGWLFVMCITAKFWVALCEALGHEELPLDPRFRGFAERRANRDALAAILDEAFRRLPTAEWMRRLAGKVPAAPVLTMSQALDNPYFRETGGVLEVPHPHRPDLKLVASPIRLDGERPGACAGAALGADTDRVLAEAGFGAAEIAALRAEGVVAG
jgi:crotonobetainyl-CoA:carnitine CoA-transferase CaiB-like acyl-CoA transferase